MSTSFADVVRARGVSLAGLASEDDAAADADPGKANPLEAVLRCPKTLAPGPVLRALISRCGLAAISCARSISATNYVVTCSSDAALLTLVSEPILEVDDARCTVSRAGEPLRSVTLRGVPFDATDDDLRRLLSPYASLLDWSHETYTDFPGIANGNRRLHIKMPIPLPNFLSFRKKRVVVSYNGVRLLCFRCGSPDHAKKDCPELSAGPDRPVPVALAVSSVVDPAASASTSMPPPETKPASKRKKSGTSPVLVPSPSPKSRKHLHAPESPVSLPPAGASGFVTPTSSPRAGQGRSRSVSPRSRSPSPAPVSQDAAAMAKVAFQARVFEHYLRTDKAGRHFRDGIEAHWIEHWCPPCCDVGSFLTTPCPSTPACSGRDIRAFAPPTTPGVHLFYFKDAVDHDYCIIDVRSRSWTVRPFPSTKPFHRGPVIPAYASAPATPVLKPA